MKKVLFALFTFCSSLLFAQNQVDSLVKTGIMYHDLGAYDQAIAVYQKALEIDPNLPLVHYEIASSYVSKKEFELAIRHCDEVIRLSERHAPQAYVVKGSCLEYLGKTDESIRLFQKGLKLYGPNHLMYANLGYNYFKINKYKKAKEALVKAIQIRSSHSSSHLLLGFVMAEADQKIQSLLCLHYFLCLEPYTDRSRTVFASMQEMYYGQNVWVKNKEAETELFLHTGPSGSEVNNSVQNLSTSETGKSDDKRFIEKTKSFFKSLANFKPKKSDVLWRDSYVPFFSALADTDHLETYCYYISSSSNPRAEEWLNSNPDKLERFKAWLGEM